MRMGHISERGLTELSKQGLLCGQSTGKLDFCEYCVFRKQCHVKFNSVVHRIKGTYWIISIRIFGDPHEYLFIVVVDAC